MDCGKRTRGVNSRGFCCTDCMARDVLDHAAEPDATLADVLGPMEGGSDGEAQEETEAQAEEATDVLTGEFAGIRYEAHPSIPRGEIVFLANKLGAIVRGRVLKGELTLHFPRGPGR